jgi:hypothetical protein
VLHFLDILYTFIHVAVIGFNLFGWIAPKTRRVHLICIVATAASWFLLGIWFGIGYCPITDWQWDVKAKLGETNIPQSFVEYYAERIFERDFSTTVIDTVTVVSFVVAAILSVYVNFIYKRKKTTVAQ